MSTTTTPTADNGVNVEAILGAREAMAETPAAAQFTWMFVSFSAVAEVAPAKVGAVVSGSVVSFTSTCLLYTSPSPRDGLLSRMPSSA